MDPAVVIDTGSGIVKAGFASEPAPKCLIPNVVGVPARRRGLLQRSKTCTDETLKELYVGDDALKEKARLELKYPMENSRIVMWDEECEIWNAAYSILDVKPSDQPVYMLTNPFNGPEERQFLSEVFFETYDVPALYFQVSAVASLYASGRVTGLAMDSGECVTHAIPVYEGFPLRHALFKTRLGGRHVTERLQRLLMGSGYNFSTSAEKDSVRVIKEKACFVHCEAESGGGVLEDEEVGLPNPSESQDVELPDGQTFTLSRERCDAPELLFRPSLISSEDMGVHELVGECLKVSDIDIRKDLMANIVTSGGNTMFPGFCRRLRHEVVECLRERMTLPGFVNVKVTEQPDRDCAAWIGGAIAASLPQFQDEVVTRAEYEEKGFDAIRRQCMG